MFMIVIRDVFTNAWLAEADMTKVTVVPYYVLLTEVTPDHVLGIVAGIHLMDQNGGYLAYYLYIFFSDKCSQCNKRVQSLQESIQCDRCEKWQHRTCNTGKKLIDASLNN